MKKSGWTVGDTSGMGKDAARAFRAELEQRGIRRAKIGGFDIDGVLRGKYVSLDKLESALRKGFGFCDVIFGWDVEDAPYGERPAAASGVGFPDVLARLDPATTRTLPWEPDVAAVLCDFASPDGSDYPACPRSMLKRVLARAEAMGFEVKAGAEFEFTLFRESPESLRAKHFRDLTPLDPGMFGYSWLRSSQAADLMADLSNGLKDFDIELEGLHPETGPGIYEAAIRYDSALRAADKAALFKTAVKQIAHEHGLTATFMAKCSAALPGNGGHIHESLWRDGKNVFASPPGAPLSEALRHYVGGQTELMAELTACFAPTVNSYRRFVPGVWAPLTATWGVENRTCALRVIEPHDASAARVEYRQPGADMNPYIALGASIAAGLWGVAERREPAAPRDDDACEEGQRLPRSLVEATARLKASARARELLGAGFVDHFVATREWEWQRFMQVVTEWELARYLEII